MTANAPDPSPTADPAGQQPAPVLTYGRPPRVRWRRLLTRAALLAWVAGVAWLAYGKWGPRAVASSHLWWSQRQCLRFAAPPDRVVVECDPERAQARLSESGYRPARSGSALTAPPAFGPVALHGAADDVWRTYRASLARWSDLEAARRPGALTAKAADLQPAPSRPQLFQWTKSPPDSLDGVVVYLGVRSAGLAERLVCVTALWDPQDGQIELFAYAHPTDLSGPLADPYGAPVDARDVYRERRFNLRGALAPGYTTPLRPVPGTTALRLFAGQPDPLDPSRFTIEYEAAGGRGRIEGRLQAYDGVFARVISGPLVGGADPGIAVPATRPATGQRSG